MTLAELALPVGLTVFVWWFSTGLILLMVRLPPARYTLALGVFGLVALGALVAVALTARTDTPAAAAIGFVAALCVWGWHEASFLMGKITGPRPLPCPTGAQGWSRFKFATLTVLHHEIALALTALGLAGLVWGTPNTVAAWTFGILFVMRLSAKFNIFLGVPNLTDEFFPDHLRHLKSYLPRRPMSPLMPVSIIASLVLAAWLMGQAQAASPDSAGSVGFVLVFTLTLMALIEHAFMVLPVRDAVLWRWAQPKSTPAATPDAKTAERPTWQ